MGVFNIIETFFFLSLAITFILILLLVNHFKQRINTLEQKCDTMFEVINSILQDVGSLSKVFSFSDPRIQAMHPVFTKPQSFYDNFNATTENSKSNPEVVIDLNDDDDDKIVVSDDDDDESDYDESGNETDIESHDYESDDDELVVDDDAQKIKIVNVDILEKIDAEIFQENEDIMSDEVAEEETLNGNDEDLEEIIAEISEIQVLKMDAIGESTDDVVESTYTDDSLLNQRDIYNKMTAQELKKIVINQYARNR